MTIKRILNKDAPDLFNFRIAAIEECGGAAKHVMMSTSYNNIYKVLSEYGASRIEDIYRFTESKWSQTKFDFIDAHYAEDGNITNISGALKYNNWIRGGIYHFGLRKYSKQYPSILFQTNGHLQRLIDYSMQQGLEGVFISIYPHVPRLRALCNALKRGTSISTTGDINLIRKLQYAGTYSFNNVPQEFFVVQLNNSVFKLGDIL
jgi:hypothetical protein